MGSCYRFCGKVVNFLRLGDKDAPTGYEKYGKAFYLREPCAWTLIHILGVFFGYCGLALLILSIMSEDWISAQEFRGGLFSHCIENMTVGIYDFTKSCTEDHYPKWQNSTIVLVLFACFFISIGALLSTVGLVTISLPEKLFFFHSTAECFFAGSLSLELGYFIWIYNGGPKRFFTIGLGFAFGIGAIVLFFIATLLMALDDIMKSCRTSMLYTDEMASISASTKPKVTPAVSAAAKAFAATAEGPPASTNKNDRFKDGDIINRDNDDDDDVAVVPSASKSSEKMTRIKHPRSRENQLHRTTDAEIPSTLEIIPSTTAMMMADASSTPSFYILGGKAGLTTPPFAYEQRDWYSNNDAHEYSRADCHIPK